MHNGRTMSEPPQAVIDTLKALYNQSVEDKAERRFTVPLDSEALYNAAIQAMLGLRIPGAGLFCAMISPRDKTGVPHAHFIRL